MAETLTISSAALAADGKAMTIDITGNTGDLTPTSGITGFVVKATVGGLVNQYPALTVTASGSTVTLTTRAAIPTGVTVTVDLPTSSNLRDSLSNSPVGQTNVAVTNNSTKAVTTYAANNAAVVGEGRTFDATVASRSSRYQDVIVFAVTVASANAAVNLTCYCQAIATVATVDNGTPTSVTPPNLAAYGTYEIASGLSVGTHTIYVYLPNTLEMAAGIQVVDSAPSIAVASGYATPILYSNATYVPSAIRYEQPYSATTVSQNACLASPAVTGCDLFWGAVTLRAACTGIQLYGFDLRTSKVRRNGVLQAPTLVGPTTAQWGFWVYGGLDSSEVAIYEVFPNNYVQSVTPTGGTGLSTAVTIPAREFVAFGPGDSIITGSSVSGVHNWPGLTAGMSNVCIVTFSKAGKKMGVDGLGYAQSFVTNYGSKTIDKIVILMGVNDMNAAVTPTDPSGSEITAFASAYASVIAAYRAQWPSAKIFCLGIFKQDAAIDSTGRPVWNTKLSDTVAAASSSNVIYVDTTDWYSGVNGALHPNGAGSWEIAQQLAPYVSPTAVAVTNAAVAAQVATDQASAPANARLPSSSIGGVAGTLDVEADNPPLSIGRSGFSY